MAEQEPRVTKIAAYYPVSHETLIDAGLGTPEMIARDNARRADLAAMRRAHPWRMIVRPWLLRGVARGAGVVADWAARGHDRLHVGFDSGCRLCEERDRWRDG